MAGARPLPSCDMLFGTYDRGAPVRSVQHVRYLAGGEKALARDVFLNTIPYEAVVISDGIGKDDAPFTMPTSIPANWPFAGNFNVREGKYVIHAGDGYYGMSTLKEDRETLIHELTHVWQGEHSRLSWIYVFSSVWHRALADTETELYGYKGAPLKPWIDYNPEQQASIVEGWFADGKREFDEATWEGDRRFYYIKRHIRGEHVDHNWLLPQITPLPHGTLHVPVESPSFDGALLRILERRFQADDVAGLGTRARELEEFFRKLEYADAQKLIARLEKIQSQGDQVAQYFHRNLPTATRSKLLQILKDRR